jgi:hypothetical protein
MLAAPWVTLVENELAGVVMRKRLGYHMVLESSGPS